MINYYYILKGKLSCKFNAEEEKEGMVLGLTRNVILNSHEIEVLQNLIINLNLPELVENNSILAYAKAKLDTNIFTSEIYQRQKNRCNYIVSWNNFSKLGIIRFFIYLDNIVYAFIREFNRDYTKCKLRILKSEKMFIK